MSRQTSPVSLEQSCPTVTSLGSSYATSRYLGPSLPATRALNDALFPLHEDGMQAVRRCRCNTTTGEDHAITENFPTITWCSTDKTGNEAQNHQLSCAGAHPSPRGSLVRSISLVSGILSDLQAQARNDDQKRPRQKQARKVLLSFLVPKPHKRPKTTKGSYDFASASETRLIPLSHPTATTAIRAGRIASTKQYFL